jgi:hypothetical protein
VSGYWTTRNLRDPDTGKTITRRFWVDTTAQTEAARRTAQAAARRRLDQAKARAEASRRAAAERARARALGQTQDRLRLAREQQQARILQQRRVAEARRASYESLQHHQSELLRSRGLVGQNKPTSSNYVSSREEMDRERVSMRDQQMRNQQAARAASFSADQAAYRKRLLLMKLTEGLHGPRQAGKKLGPHNLSPEDVRMLERVLRDEAQNAKKGQFDSSNIEKLRQAYEKHAVKVYDDYEHAVAAVNAAIDSGDLEKARKLYDQYKKLVPEFQRLFGNGKDPLKDGAYNDFYQQYKNISVAQQEWWKRQMKASLEATAASVDERPGRDNSAAQQAQETLDVMNGKIKTRFVPNGVDEHGRPRYRHMTIDEELAARQAEKIMAEEKLRAQWGAQQNAIRVQMMRQGMVEYKGQYIPREQLPVVQQAEQVMNQFYSGKFEPKSPHDIHEFVDKMLSQWDSQHQKPYPGRVGGLNGAQMALANEDWARSRKAYEDQAYKFFGLGPQGILEKGMDTPGIRDALALLSGPFSALGAGARVLNAAFFHENTVGGVAPTSSVVPDAIKAEAA